MEAYDILIVDDSPDNVELLADILHVAGYKTRAVMRGADALATAREDNPRLILLDLLMPDVDGLEICESLKEDAHTHDIPVIFLSAVDQTSQKVKAFHQGAVDYITIPFRKDEVLARVETHLAMRTLRENLRIKNTELEKRVYQLATLNHIMQAAAGAHSLESVLTTVAETITHFLNGAGTTISLLEKARTELRVAAMFRRPTHEREEGPADMIGLRVPLSEDSSAAEVLRTRKSVIVEQARNNPLTANMREYLEKDRVESLMDVPLKVRGEIIGIIAVTADTPERVFTEEDLSLAETIAGQIAGSIENARLLERELRMNAALMQANARIRKDLDMARDTQFGLLRPARPEWPELDVLCYMVPARTVGGDFYSYHAFGRRHYVLAVGDISGKGVPAALLMAVTQSHFDSSLVRNYSAEERLVYLDKVLSPSTRARGQFCAMCYVEFRMDEGGGSGLLRFVNAGGVPPIIKRATGEVQYFDFGAPPLGLGVGNAEEYRPHELPLSEGDFVILISDGVAEANMVATNMLDTHKETDDPLGFLYLERVIKESPAGTAAAMLEDLKRATVDLNEEGGAHDDMTIVVAHVPRR